MNFGSVGPVAVLALGLLAAGCGGGQQLGTGPVAPTAGGSKLTIEKIDPEKWRAAFRQANQNTLRLGFTCRVLHCPEPANVVLSYTTLRSKPTAQDLDKVAKETLPKLIEARNLQFQVQTNNKGRIDRLSSTRTKIAGHDALLQEIKLVVGEQSRFSSTAMLFIGRQSITINSEAGDRATARRSIDEFASNITVEEGPQS
jgi:hypothetical protein